MHAVRPRPDWLLPLAVGTFVALVVVGVTAFFLTRGGDGDFTAFANRVNPTLEGVASADRDLAAQLEGAAGSNAASDVAQAARVVAGDIDGARNAVAVAGGTGRVTDARVALVRALDANRRFAERVEASAARPSVASVASAAGAARTARERYAQIAHEYPQLRVPESSSLTTGRLASLASARAGAKRSLVTYVHQIDRALANSSAERTNIQAVYQKITSDNVDALSAHDQLNAIIAQRHSLQDTVAAVQTPMVAQHAEELLRVSLAASIDDDNAILGMLNARLNEDPVVYEQHLEEHREATARATAAKRAFLVAFNRLRRKVGETPLPIDYRY